MKSHASAEKFPFPDIGKLGAQREEPLLETVQYHIAKTLLSPHDLCLAKKVGKYTLHPNS